MPTQPALTRTPASWRGAPTSSIGTEAALVSAGQQGRSMRTQLMVLVFYIVDALFMAAYAVHGTLPALAPLAFGAAGCGLTGLFAAMMRVGLHRRIGSARFTTLQLLSASSLMLITAAMVPQIGLLLLLTLIVCQHRTTFPQFRRSKFPHPVAAPVLSR